MRRWLVTASFLAPLTISSVALADDNCPPGSWFCEEVKVELPVVGGGVTVSGSIPGPNVVTAPQQQPQVDDEVATSPEDSPEATAPPKKRTHKKKRRTKRVEVETVEVPPEQDTVVVVRREPNYQPVTRRTKKVVRRWRDRFGLNLRVEGAAFASNDSSRSTAGMGGAGGSFRWRPSRWFAFDIGVDVLGGNDYNGDERLEVAGSLSGIVYFNPQHRVQAYAIAGVNVTHASVDTAASWYDRNDDTFEIYDQTETRNYFGGHFGLGMEVRLGTHFGLSADVLAIIRTRIDSDVPEYVDRATGETTNTSGAGLFRIGANFWW